MPKILDLLKTQKYTVKRFRVAHKGYITANVDETLSPDELSKKISSSDNSIPEALARGPEGITALQYIAEQRLYTTKTPGFWDYASSSLFDSSQQRVPLSFEYYAELKYNHDDFHQVFAALIKPFEDKETNNNFTDLLLMKNQAGQTVLHSYFRNFKKWGPIQPVFDRFLKLNTEQKKDILTITDNQGQNILHVLAEKEWKFDFIKDLNEDEFHDALLEPDNLGKTPLHYLFNQGQAALSNIKLISQKMLQPKDRLVYEEKIISTTDNARKNILHYALAQKKSSDAKEKVLAVLSFFKKEGEPGAGIEDKKNLTEQQRIIFFKALSMSDRQGLTPFQHACKNNHDDSIKLIFQLLNPDQQKVLVLQNKSKALHFICRYGTKGTLDKILNLLEPKEIYEIFKKEGGRLRQRVLANHNLNSINFEYTINDKIGWFKVYDYLKRREKESSWFHPVADFDKRADDFIKRLNFKGNVMSFPYDPSFDRGLTTRYKESIEHLTVNQKQQDYLKSMIREDTTDPLDYKIAASLDSKCVLTDIKKYLVKLKTAEDQAKYFKWNKKFERYMGDFITCLRSIRDGGKAPPYDLDEASHYKKFRNGLEFVNEKQATDFLTEMNDEKTEKDAVTLQLKRHFPPAQSPEKRLEA